MTPEAMDVCLRVLKESNKSRFDSYSVRNSVLIISHITFRDCRVHILSDNLSSNSCMCTLLQKIKEVVTWRDNTINCKENITQLKTLITHLVEEGNIRTEKK